MTIAAAALQSLHSHWALSAIPEVERTRAAELVNERLVRQAVGRQITFSFAESEADEGLLERVALAYEMAAIALQLSCNSGNLRNACDRPVATTAAVCAAVLPSGGAGRLRGSSFPAGGFLQVAGAAVPVQYG